MNRNPGEAALSILETVATSMVSLAALVLTITILVVQLAMAQFSPRIVPNYAMIDHDRHIPFWRAVGDAVHEHDCRFILQLSHAGR
ncbi:MAG: DUF2254 domain-containing protein, partial [Acidobacteria bacterium]|nr:DUF2254 domain-containing protein [Acidobacteriota bacterium]